MELPLLAPSLEGVEHAVERDRVFEALFQVPAERQRLGRYVVLGRLGRGAMGMVLEAFDRMLDRRVAVKVLHRELSERHRARLVREAQALAKLSHPNVVQVYEVGESEEGQVFIAMELVRGRSLSEWLRQEPRPGWRECVQAYLQAGEGLAAAHAEGLVHRDFKPDNTVIDDKGRVRVLDFGLVRQAEDAEVSDADVSVSDLRIGDPTLASELTVTGTVLGTPAYMPLEQMDGRRADARSDQFSFCAALHEALYGERPFEGAHVHALMLALQDGRVRAAPKGTAVPESLRRVVLRGLATDPGGRWPSMDALLVELRRQVAPHRRAWWALGLAGGLVAVGMGLARYAEVGFRCEGAREQLAGIWDEARAREVEAAILGTGVSYAPDTAVRVDTRLDDYAEAWVASHTEVCEATSVRQEQSAEVMDLRMGCLRERRVALREAVDVLAEADATRVENAVKLVASLPALSRCDDVEALAAVVAPPEDPQVAARVEVLRDQLAHTRVLLDAGVHDEGLAEAELLVEQAKELAYPPLLAEALLTRSLGYEGMVRRSEAEQDAEQAYLLAAEHGHGEVEARAVSRLVWLVAGDGMRHDAALQWGKTALVLARRRRAEPELEARTLLGLGVASSIQGRREESLTHFEGALAIYESSAGARHPDYARALALTGNALVTLDMDEEGVACLRRALAIYEEVLGPRHVAVSSVLNSLGNTLLHHGQLEEALRHVRRALTIREDALGPGHPSIDKALLNIALVLLMQGRLEEALVYNERALSLAEQEKGSRHVYTAWRHFCLGVVLQEQGRLEDALAHYRTALGVWTEARIPDVASAIDAIGTVLQAQGKPNEAFEHLQRALAIRVEANGPDHSEVSVSHDNLGKFFLSRGKLEEARVHHQRALAIRQRVYGPNNLVTADSHVGLAEVALAEQDFGAAREHAERALSIRESSETSPRSLAEARFVVARALIQGDRSGRARARGLARQARDTYADLGTTTQDELAKVDAWLAERSGR